MKRHNALKNTIRAVLDEYFPELVTVFKYPLKGKACRQILKSCPFPSLILQLWIDGILTQIKKAVKKTVGQKRVERLLEAARNSIGVTYGIQSARLKLFVFLRITEINREKLSKKEIDSWLFLPITKDKVNLLTRLEITIFSLII